MVRVFHRLGLIILSVLALLAMTAGIASAHAKYESSVPAADATVATAPSSVTVKFTEELKSDGNELKVTDASGAVMDNGDTTLDKGDADRKTIVVTLKSGMANGTYTVNWKNSSTDGHSEQGSFKFTVGAASAAAPAAPAKLPTTGAEHSLPWLILPISVLLVGLGLALRFSATRR